MKKQTCKKCQQSKTMDRFYTEPNGYVNKICRDCYNEKVKLRYHNDPEKREAQKIASRDWTKRNMDKHNVYIKNWAAANPEKVKAMASVYMKKRYQKFAELRDDYFPHLAIDSLYRLKKADRATFYDLHKIPEERRI